MLFPLSKHAAVNLDSIYEIYQDRESGPNFVVHLRDTERDDSPEIDAKTLRRLIAASAPIVPGDGWRALSYRFDEWGLPRVTIHPVIAWRIVPNGAEPVTVTPLRQTTGAFLSPCGFVHLVETGEVIPPREWGARLALEKARADGRVLDAPPVADDPLA